MSIFSLFFWFAIMLLSYTLILPVLQFQTQKVMMSHIRSHIEYLIQTYNILVHIVYSKLMKNLVSLTVFNRIKWWFLIAAFFGLFYFLFCNFYINFQLKCLGMEFTAYKDELMPEEALTSFTICNAHWYFVGQAVIYVTI